MIHHEICRLGLIREYESTAIFVYLSTERLFTRLLCFGKAAVSVICVVQILCKLNYFEHNKNT